MPTGQRAPADPTQGETLAGYCATCGNVILSGDDDVWEDEFDQLFCSAYCVARAHAYSVTCDGETRVRNSRYTLDEALRFTQRYWDLRKRAHTLRGIYLETAMRLRAKGHVAEALRYEDQASDIERWLLEDEPPAGGGDRAGDIATQNGAELGHSAPSS